MKSRGKIETSSLSAQNSASPLGRKAVEDSDLLIRLRTKRRLNQVKMAKELGMSFSRYGYFETRRLLPTEGPERQAIIEAAKAADVNAPDH